MSDHKTDYIIFSDDRSGIPTSSMHLAGQLTNWGRVFWLNTYTRSPGFSRKDFAKVFRVVFGRSGQVSVSEEVVESKIHAFTPKSIPWFVPPVRKINGVLGRRFLHQLFREYQIQSPVLITTFPCTVDTFRAVRGETTQIYYCVDEWSELEGLHPQRWRTMEQELLELVDGTAYTSRDLLQRKSQGRPSLYLPHGVDYEHFAGAKNMETVPEMIASLPKPMIGFFGIIDTWVDIGVIATLAKRFPQYSFVIVGRSAVSLDVFHGLENVYFSGPVPYTELPSYARTFDVGLIPFALNNLTQSVNPLKLMEYFALGLPVISTRLPDILDVPGPLFFASTHQEFGDRLEVVLSHDQAILKKEAQETAKKNNWDARTEDFVRFIETVRSQKANTP